MSDDAPQVPPIIARVLRAFCAPPPMVRLPGVPRVPTVLFPIVKVDPSRFGPIVTPLGAPVDTITDEEVRRRAALLDLRDRIRRQEERLAEYSDQLARATRAYEAAAAVLDDRALEYGRAVPILRAHLFSGLRDAGDKAGHAWKHLERVRFTYESEVRHHDRLLEQVANWV